MQKGLADDLRLGLTPEFLYEEYIVKDRSLEALAAERSISIGKIRGALKRAGVQKSSEQIKAKVSRIANERIANNGSNFSKISPEQRKVNHAKTVVTRNANRSKQLQEEGLTEERLHRLYIEENRSLKELEEQLSLSRKTVRNLLKRYEIVKTQEYRDSARRENLTAFYEDPESVESMILKRNETVAERYGRSWYRKTTSKEEDALLEAVRSRHPHVRMLQSDWSTIRRESNNAQLQLDILFPDLNLAIEYNGEYYHDRERYEASLQGEGYSPEVEKSLLCRKAGVELIHVWSSDLKADPEAMLTMIEGKIDAAEARLGLTPEFLR